jgi:hypothetical protein
MMAGLKLDLRKDTKNTTDSRHLMPGASFSCMVLVVSSKYP